MEVATKPAVRWVWLAGLVLALALGAVLRLVWVGDIEYKADEEWTYRQARDAVRAGQWPRFGMPASAGPLNPGPSVWVFVLLGEVTGTDPDATRPGRRGAEHPGPRRPRRLRRLPRPHRRARSRGCGPRRWPRSTRRPSCCTARSGRRRCCPCSPWSCWPAGGGATGAGGPSSGASSGRWWGRSTWRASSSPRASSSGPPSSTAAASPGSAGSSASPSAPCPCSPGSRTC